MNQRTLAPKIATFWSRIACSSTVHGTHGGTTDAFAQSPKHVVRHRLPVKRAAAVSLGVMLFSGAACTTPDASSDTLVADIRAMVANSRGNGFGNSLAGNYLAGLHAVQVGELRAAAESFEAALRKDPENAELRRQIFLLHLTAGDFEAALQDAEELADTDPGLEAATLLLALDDSNNG
ncbi:MAG: tetratricopeptide repeat protein, partial [Pseudomonadota bacterium]